MFAGTTSSKAFTLVEILVVVVIVGIAAAVIVPQIGSRGDLRAAAAARMVMADLIYAQNRAISTQTRHYVVFDTTSTARGYRLTTSITPLVNIPHPLTKASEYQITFGAGSLDGVTLDNVDIEGQKIVVFDELGVPYYYNGTTGTTTALSVKDGSSIRLKSGNVTLSLLIEPYTGEISVPE